jgi:DNA-directed RNA polymerase specialized sigma24 family protein
MPDQVGSVQDPKIALWEQGTAMFRKPETANSRADYATPADFCKLLESDMKPLYRLAFLLTTCHHDAERCFVATIDASSKQQTVFKPWALPWLKRSLIKNAIQIVSPASTTGKCESPRAERPATPGDSELDAVTRLAPLERFVFVMSVLERYSDWECSLLLGCHLKEVAKIRTRAFRELPGRDTLFPHSEAMFSDSLQVTA